MFRLAVVALLASQLLAADIASGGGVEAARTSFIAVNGAIGEIVEVVVDERGVMANRVKIDGWTAAPLSIERYGENVIVGAQASIDLKDPSGFYLVDLAARKASLVHRIKMDDVGSQFAILGDVLYFESKGQLFRVDIVDQTSGVVDAGELLSRSGVATDGDRLFVVSAGGELRGMDPRSLQAEVIGAGVDRRRICGISESVLVTENADGFAAVPLHENAGGAASEVNRHIRPGVDSVDFAGSGENNWLMWFWEMPEPETAFDDCGNAEPRILSRLNLFDFCPANDTSPDAPGARP